MYSVQNNLHCDKNQTIFFYSSYCHNQIGIEINIYIEVNPSSASYQIGLEIEIYTKMNAFNASN